MKYLKLIFAGLFLLATSAGQCATQDEASSPNRWDEQASRLRLVPFPKQVRVQTGAFSLGKPLLFEISEAPSGVGGRLLKEELKRAGLPTFTVRPLKAPNPVFRITTGNAPWSFPSLAQLDAPESYTLEVREQEIIGAANHPAGLFYALQTLCQLIRANRQGDALACLTIRDWPSLRWRCVQDDMTRGPSSTLDTLKFEASLGAYLKLNLMTFYMEYQYAFKKHPKIGPPNGSLTPEDLSALVMFVKPLHLDILGNQQSFGHFAQILKHPEYARLRETGDVLTPVREETYQLLDDLYSEVCPLLPFPWFNVCCDETYGLGQGPSRELAAKIGVGGVYVQHIRRVHDLLRDKHQKRMMMWGDIILQHPNHLKDVPKDTLMLTWGYDARPSFEDQIIPFAKSGYEFFVCPGVNNWSRILPDFGVAVTNIQHFVRDGVKHGALGMLNTDWEDDGEAINAVKWHADAWAAECAWNASTTALADFNRRVGAVLFGESGGHFGQAITLLTRTHRLPGMNGMMNARFWEKDFVPQKSPAAIQTAASNLLAIARPAIAHLEACRQEARVNSHLLQAFLFGARRMEFMGQRMLDGLEATQLYAQASEASAPLEKLAQVEQLIRATRDTYQSLGKQFAALWHSESKPYALDWTLKRYANAVESLDPLLDKLAAARAAVTAGKPLPAPEEIGLALPRPLSRRVRPRETLPTTLAPETAWADPSATHRLGLSIRAGATNRFDLPVEVDLTLPDSLVAKPVRAFLIHAQETPLEVLAQVDPLGQRGKNRLVLMLPGPLLTGQEAAVHVYLGLLQQPSPLPSAVSTRPGSGGMVWMENDQVRLWLGTEGAHAYRWEIKAANHRDLTMPGETGWAGFGDIGYRRHSPYRLTCTARGPALVEYQCTDAEGYIRNIRLYGGTSWIEVLLGEPTPLYWDFDDPKNFAADGPAPGAWLFSNGQTGSVGREADGVPAQVKMPNTYWGIKYNANRLALGLVTPGTPAFHHIAPGAGAGGVGIEGSPPVRHFVTYAGLLESTPAETMNRLQATLNLHQPVVVQLHSLQARMAQQPPLMDRELFFGDPEISGAQISPDGQYVAFIKPWKGTRNVWVKRAEEAFDQAKLLTADTKRPIPSYFWSRDAKYILFVQDQLGDENFNVFAVNPADAPAEGSPTPTARNLTQAKGVRTMLYAVPRTDPDTIYIGLNERDKAWHDLYKVKISTGEKTLVIKNTERLVGYIFDLKDQLRLAVRRTAASDTEILRIDGDQFTRIYSGNVFETCNPIRFHQDNQRLYLETNVGDELNLSRLALLNLETGQTELVEKDPVKRVDFGGALISERTDALLATTYTDERERIYWKDQ